MEEQIRTLVVLAFVGLLILLRLDAYRFGAAEYDDELAGGGWRTGALRFAWYALGVGLVVVIFLTHPRPNSVLHLGVGTDRLQALLAGIAIGLMGAGAAIAFAWWRYRRFRLPDVRHYPGAAANSLGTAIIDEAAFRGALLGLLIVFGMPEILAVAFQAAAYGLATRLGKRGRSRSMLTIFIGVGAVAGLVTLVTGGIGAALVGHAITRFAIFVCTGHAGQVKPTGYEPEEQAGRLLPPPGFEVVHDAREGFGRDWGQVRGSER